jgi:dTDP-6-deoxy-L-talose 4-dehydrogenase (NAD+)
LDLHAPGSHPFAVLGRPDVLIHLAWSGLPNYGSVIHTSVERPAQIRFLRTLVEQGLSKLVVAGTCMEYGMHEGELTESDAVEPANPYAAAKNALRLEMESVRRAMPFDLTWTRIFYLYGDGQAPTSLYAQMAAADVNGVDLELSSGDQVRDFLPVEVAARALLDLALLEGGHGVVNVCSGRPVSVRDMADSWISEKHWRVRPRYGARPQSPFEPHAFWGNKDKLDRLVGGATA